MHSGALVMEPIESDSSELLTRARNGDLQSFDQIMILHQRRVLHTALRILGNLPDAQDATQEVFLRFYKYLNRFDPTRSLPPWLYRLTVNVCHDIRKKRTQTSELPETLTVTTTDHSADLQIMTQALQTLPEKERSALVLRDIEGLSTKEVAEILGSTETTVRSQISRARIKLKEFRTRILRRQL